MTHSVAFDNAFAKRPATVEEQVNIIASRPLDAHPGDGWYYRSATNQVGVLVEKISGLELGRLSQREIVRSTGDA